MHKSIATAPQHAWMRITNILLQCGYFQPISREFFSSFFQLIHHSFSALSFNTKSAVQFTEHNVYKTRIGWSAYSEIAWKPAPNKVNDMLLLNSHL